MEIETKIDQIEADVAILKERTGEITRERDALLEMLIAITDAHQEAVGQPAIVVQARGLILDVQSGENYDISPDLTQRHIDRWIDACGTPPPGC
jgi:hypothetical protein